MTPVHPDPAVGKAQWIRLADVFVVGPLMIYGGVRTGGLAGSALGLFGVGAIVLNGYNYLRYRRRT